MDYRLEVPENAAGECYTESLALWKYLRDRGVRADLIAAGGYFGNFSQAAKNWSGSLPKHFNHWMVRVGEHVIDMTATQIGPTHPKVRPFPQEVSLWDRVDIYYDYPANKCHEQYQQGRRTI